MLKRINEVVREIWYILLAYGVLVQAAGMWFVEDKVRYTTGLWIGIVLAMFMIWHMHLGLSKALEMDENGARKRQLLMYSVRLIIIIAIILLIFYLKLGNVILTFIGVFGLKIAAYLQPVLHQRLSGVQGKEGE